MIKNYLKADLQQKLKIPLSILDEKRNGRFSSNVDKILEQISEMKVPNLSIDRQVSPPEQTPEPKFQIYKQEVQPHIIIPMQRVAFIELQKKHQLQQRDRDILMECQYRGKVLKEQSSILRAGFPLKKMKVPNLYKKNHSVDLQSSHHQFNQEIEDLLSSKISDSEHSIPIQPDNNNSTKVATYANSSQDYLNISMVGEKTVNQSTQIQIIPEILQSEGKVIQLRFDSEKQNQNSSYLPHLPSSLNKKTTVFGTEDRNKVYLHEQSPGPAQYTIRRFGEKARGKKKPIKQNEDESAPTYRVMKLLSQRSQSLLPPVKQEFSSEQVTKRVTIQKNNNDRYTDKYGYPLYPITDNRINPGPADYETNINSIAKKVEFIREEQKVRGEIKQWLQKQQSFSQM